MRRFSLLRIRLFFQVIYTIITNGYLYGFFNGKIYKGSLKYACVPGLNCYSCPGAVASCPLGALQAALYLEDLYVVGFVHLDCYKIYYIEFRSFGKENSYHIILC